MTQIKDPDGLEVMLRGWLGRSAEQAGEWRTLGLFAADDAGQLQQTLASMPLKIWRTDQVTPLAPSEDPDVLTVEGDISEQATADQIISQAIDRFGRVDTLVNNAGVFVSKPFTDYTAEDYALVTGVNLAGFFWLTQRAIGQMLKQHSGHVVNVSASVADRADSAEPTALAALCPPQVLGTPPVLPRRLPADPLSLKPSGSVQSVGSGEETVRGRPQRVIPVTIAGGRAGLRRTGCGLRTARKEGKRNGRIKLDLHRHGDRHPDLPVHRRSPGAHRRQPFPGLPWDADQPGRTKQRPNPDQASSDPGGNEIPAASAV